jgi:hypothetical protein
VDDEMSVEAAGELRRHEETQLFLRRPPRKARRNEERLVPGGDAEPLELVDDSRDGVLSRVVRGTGDGQSGRLDDDRRAPAAPDEGLEALALEREAQRVANSRGDVCDGLPRRWRAQDDGIVRGRREDEPRAGEERDPLHR